MLGIKMVTKNQIVLLSLISVLSSFFIVGLTIVLVVSDTDTAFSLISNPCLALKSLSLIACLLFTIKYAIVFSFENSVFKEKIKTQIITLLKASVLLLTISFMYHFITVLFGAPVFTFVSETYHFALLMTVLTAVPLCSVAGPRLDKWIDIFTLEREPGLQTVVYLTTIGALLGAWLGAIPIPLDWDRPWQNWPISCSIGSVSGYSICLFIASLYLPHQYKASLKPKSV